MAKFNTSKLENFDREVLSINLYQNIIEKHIKSNKNIFIVDAGAEIGYYLKAAIDVFTKLGDSKKGIELKICCFEPDPLAFNILKINKQKWLEAANFAHEIKLINVALSNESDKIPIHIGKKSSTVLTNQYNKEMTFMVNSSSVDEHFYQTNKIIDIMKVDIEGYEYFMIFGCLKMLQDKRIKNIILEIHWPMLKMVNLDGNKMRNFIKNFGYKEKLIESEDNKNETFHYTVA